MVTEKLLVICAEGCSWIAYLAEQGVLKNQTCQK